VRLTILSIGRDRSRLFEPAAQEYLTRLQRYLPAEALVAGEAQGEDAAARRLEAGLLRKKLPDSARWVALDERGESLNSRELAERFNSEARRGTRALAFVLGGPSGLDPELTDEASWTLALSRFTLPHQLARVVLLEQLYRAQTILKGEPYSK
jgi:23S rRNA (pseudouridine1915-N3)-methyltransferase